VSSQQNKIKKSRIFNKSPARQTENVAGSVWFSMFMKYVIPGFIIKQFGINVDMSCVELKVTLVCQIVNILPSFAHGFVSRVIIFI
jgi:hypothetical protein